MARTRRREVVRREPAHGEQVRHQERQREELHDQAAQVQRQRQRVHGNHREGPERTAEALDRIAPARPVEACALDEVPRVDHRDHRVVEEREDARAVHHEGGAVDQPQRPGDQPRTSRRGPSAASGPTLRWPRGSEVRQRRRPCADRRNPRAAGRAASARSQTAGSGGIPRTRAAGRAASARSQTAGSGGIPRDRAAGRAASARSQTAGSGGIPRDPGGRPTGLRSPPCPTPRSDRFRPRWPPCPTPWPSPRSRPARARPGPASARCPSPPAPCCWRGASPPWGSPAQRRPGVGRGGLRLGGRKQHLEARTALGSVADPDPAPVTTHDAQRGGESEPPPRELRGEERVEDPLLDRLLESGA